MSCGNRGCCGTYTPRCEKPRGEALWRYFAYFMTALWGSIMLFLWGCLGYIVIKLLGEM